MNSLAGQDGQERKGNFWQGPPIGQEDTCGGMGDKREEGLVIKYGVSDFLHR